MEYFALARSDIHMMQTKLPLRLLAVIMLTGALASCGAKDPVKAVQVSAPVAPNIVSIENAELPTLQSACTDRITANMPDPTAANVSYTPLSGEDGYQAEVILLTRGNAKPLKFDYTCHRAADGEVITKRISD